MIRLFDCDVYSRAAFFATFSSSLWSKFFPCNFDFQVTGSHDKSLRLWERTDEPLFVEEEREQVSLESLLFFGLFSFHFSKLRIEQNSLGQVIYKIDRG